MCGEHECCDSESRVRVCPCLHVGDGHHALVAALLLVGHTYCCAQVNKLVLGLLSPGWRSAGGGGCGGFASQGAPGDGAANGPGGFQGPYGLLEGDTGC